jgi:hypothetical protein
MHVPKPAFMFTVGVTGHRSARLKDEHRGRISEQLAHVFENIEDGCKAEFSGNKWLYSGDAPHVQLITSLADGTDAMAVERCPSSWTSVGLLPYPEDRYVAELRGSDYSKPDEAAVAAYQLARKRTAGNIAILPQSEHDDASGFARARNLLLRQIDLLVAVWDTSPSEDAGGTADVIRHALQAGIPVVWIAAHKDQKPWVISHIDDVLRDVPMADATSGPIAETVQQESSLGERHAGRGLRWQLNRGDAKTERYLRGFLKESVPNAYHWVFYDWIKAWPRLWLWRLTRNANSVRDVSREWQPFLAALPDGGGFKQRLEAVLLPRYAATDALATYYSHKYRSAYVLAYLLSVFAVASALTSFVLFGSGDHQAVPRGEIVLAGFELLFVALIVAIVRSGQIGRWHDRWLDYRALAEMLRHLRFLGLLGQYEKRAYLESAARPSAGWVLWYFRSTMRELGLPLGDLGPEYQRKILLAFTQAELNKQIEYHADNMAALRRLHRGLHRSGDICFGLAAAVLSLFLIVLVISHWAQWIAQPLAELAPYVTAFTALLPAFGAAFAGIRFTGDFEGFAERSAQTGSELEAIRQRCEIVLNQLDFDTPANALFESARIMAADINGWTTLYTRKHLTLPG